MSRRQYRDRTEHPRQKPLYKQGQAVYVSSKDLWVRVLEVKFWDSGLPYYWVEKEDGSSIALSESYLT